MLLHMNMQLIWDNFLPYIDAAEILLIAIDVAEILRIAIVYGGPTSIAFWHREIILS